MPQRTPFEIGVLHELEPTVEANLNRHFTVAEDWNPHDYVPWDQGRNFAFLGGGDYDPAQSELSADAQLAMTLNLLTEDNLPSYHHEILDSFGADGPWGIWVGRWTAEEGRHAIAMRDYLVVTRGVDPVALEAMRMEHVQRGYHAPWKTPLEKLVYVSFQELATRVSHRNTGEACGDPIAEQLMARVSKDENLHMVFYRDLARVAMDIAPDVMMQAVTTEVKNFAMPGADLPGFARTAQQLANAGIYTPTQHLEEILKPILRKWKVFERADFGPTGEQAREELDEFLGKLTITSGRFEERQAKKKADQEAAGITAQVE